MREGIARERIFVVGNPINEVLQSNASQIEASTALQRLEVRPKEYFLVTLHRAENVDDPTRLALLWRGLARLADRHGHPMLVSLHPRTADRMDASQVQPGSDSIRLLRPLGFWDFANLERNARCVLSDSGTVQEECSILRTPNVTIRDVTERAETVECGSNVLTGSDPEAIEQAARLAMELPRDWSPPAEYLEPHASVAVTKVVLGYHRRTGC